MFYEHLIEKFFPWSLKIDCKTTINALNKEKEKFMCDMFNHFASSFHGVASFELHMFRVSFSKINMINCDLISIVLPTHDKYHSVYIVYGEKKCDYFVLNKTNAKFDLINYNDNVSCGSVDIDLNNLSLVINNYLLKK